MNDSVIKRLLLCGMMPKHFEMTFEAWTGNEGMKARLLQWGAPEGPRNNLLLTGPTGTGKSFALAAIANRVGEYSRIQFLRSVDLMGRLRQAATDDYETPEEWMDALVRGQGYIFIDDLGAERPTEFVCEKLFDLFDRIELHKRDSVVITTNLNADELADRLGARTAFRIINEFEPIVFSGANRRTGRM